MTTAWRFASTGRRREPVVVQRLHERELLQRRQPRHVQPGRGLAGHEVVAVALDAAEARPPEARELEHHLLPLGVAREVHVRLLAHPDLAAELHHVAALHEGVQRQHVIALVGQPVPVVLLRVVVDELEPVQVREVPVRPAVPQLGNVDDDLQRHHVVVLHAHLHGHGTRMLLRQVPHALRVELAQRFSSRFLRGREDGRRRLGGSGLKNGDPFLFTRWRVARLLLFREGSDHCDLLEVAPIAIFCSARSVRSRECLICQKSRI